MYSLPVSLLDKDVRKMIQFILSILLILFFYSMQKNIRANIVLTSLKCVKDCCQSIVKGGFLIMAFFLTPHLASSTNSEIKMMMPTLDANSKDTIVDSRVDSAVVDYLSKEWHVHFSSNNRIVIFKRGQEKFDDMFEAIRHAKKSIHLEYFNFRNDSISQQLFTLLAERAANGVEVRALFDGFGNSSNNRPLKQKHLQMLREHGIEIYEFDPIRFPWLNHVMHRDHRKIVVIDGIVAYTGGMNVADYYINGKAEFGQWRDIHVRVEGDVVGDLQSVFLDFWNRVTGQRISGISYYPGERDARISFPSLKMDKSMSSGEKCVGVVNRDVTESPRIIHDTFLKIINASKKQIQIINPYFTLCGHIKRALKRAVKRGVDVQIMVSEKSDIPITPRIVEYNVHKLMKVGAKVYFFQGGFHHSKIMMADSVCAFIGSANLNSRSLSFDYECNLFIADRETTIELQSIFENDKQQSCFRLTPQRWKLFSRWRRMKGVLFHILSPVVDNN